MQHKARFSMLALLLASVLSAFGCGLDEGMSGDLPPQNVFLESEGCPVENEGEEPREYSLGPVTVPPGVARMEATLEVFRGEVDLVLGTERPPSDYFGFGRGPGTQKILVDDEYSREPLPDDSLIPWFVKLVSPFEIQGTCEPGDDPDWRLTLRRATPTQGRLLLEQEGQLPACTPAGCVPESIQIEVPEQALSMEFLLLSLEGDADLLVGLGSERESLVSLNAGPGYDVAVLGPGKCVPLRGQSVFVLLESWGQATDYRLEVFVLEGEWEAEAL